VHCVNRSINERQLKSNIGRYYRASLIIGKFEFAYQSKVKYRWADTSVGL